MKIQIPKWKLVKIDVTRDGVIDPEISGYELQKNGLTLCKLKEESISELKDFLNDYWRGRKEGVK